MLDKISQFGAKLGSQRHMVVIRDSFAASVGVKSFWEISKIN